MKIFFTFLLFLCVLSFSVQADDIVLRSHEATYTMKQIRQYDRNWSSLERADGVLRYKFSQTCEGWMVEHHTAMHMEYENAQQVQMTWSYTSWEAKDGSKLRFRSKTKQNGVVSEQYRGEARKEANKTVVIYAEPNGRREVMPPETLFPTSHQKRSLEVAAKGETIFIAPYFDGSGENADFEVSSVLTKFKGKALHQVQEVQLPKSPTWNIQLAFFNSSNSDSQPEMEISARYRLDGVSTNLKHDFGDFVLEGQLVELTYLDEPICE